MAVYAYPDVGRAGLGNMLFAWARAEVFADRYKVPILAPRWVQPKIGPLLRREKDLRYYTGLFDNARGGYIRGLRRAVILNRAQVVDQEDASAFMGGTQAAAGTHVVKFSGWKGWFEELLLHRDLIARRLEAILSDATQRRLHLSGDRPEIAVHIRRGDKVPIAFGQALSGDAAETLPDQWYLNTIRAVRSAMGGQVSVRIFSDAKAGQIEEILREPGVTRSPDNPSIVDILLLSRARVLIGTGGSSFSGWASFLGAMPTVWYPGSGMPLIEGRPELSVEADLEGNLDARGIAGIRAAGR